MEFSTYDSRSLRNELSVFEQEYGISSELHYHVRYRNELPNHIDAFTSLVWASKFKDWKRMRSEGK